ncbi:hypothetical protein NDU88_003004 [Pleurodeles waltl]|uniref:Uncharacterized protein n=1 Tax=Pleurodeles waltl TaxID=8319 RepID=A0AAV7NF69_PLEWA|nr:hypothetical protein NDU88_003004 [Pleurodeles waltl]
MRRPLSQRRAGLSGRHLKWIRGPKLASDTTADIRWFSERGRASLHRSEVAGTAKVAMCLTPGWWRCRPIRHGDENSEVAHNYSRGDRRTVHKAGYLGGTTQCLTPRWRPS